MKQIEQWPAPDWVEVRVSWETIMLHYSHRANDMFDWVVAAPGDEFHLCGYGDAEGFSYRFKDPKDATLFALMWSK